MHIWQMSMLDHFGFDDNRAPGLRPEYHPHYYGAFVLDRNGVIAREWRAVKVPGHAEEVLNFVKAL